MKIILFTQYFWPETFDINGLARSLKRKGVETEIITAKPNYPGGQIYPGYSAWGFTRDTFCDMPVLRVPIVPRGNTKLGLALNYISDIVFASLYSMFARPKSQDCVILVHGMTPIFQVIPALIYRKMHKIPVALWVQDLWPESLSATGYVKSKFLLGLARRVVKALYSHCDLILVQSKAFIPWISRMAPSKRIIYYPNSVDPSFRSTSPSIVPQIPGLGTGFSVLFAGNIGRAQDMGVILECAKLLKRHEDIHIVIMGDGSKKSWLLTEALRGELANLHIVGKYKFEDMPAIMRKASCLLLTLADHDIFAATIPNKLQAYLASGKPVIACSNGEAARIVEEARAGLTVNAGNSVGLAEAILNLSRMNDKSLAVLGDNARSYSEQNFDQDMLTDQLVADLSSLKSG